MCTICLLYVHTCTCNGIQSNLSIPDTLGPNKTDRGVLISEVH